MFRVPRKQTLKWTIGEGSSGTALGNVTRIGVREEDWGVQGTGECGGEVNPCALELAPVGTSALVIQG